MRSTMTAVVPAVCTDRQWRSVRAAAKAKFSDAHLPSWLLDGCTKINPITAKNKWLQLLGNITDRGDENKTGGLTTVRHPPGARRQAVFRAVTASWIPRIPSWCSQKGANEYP
jgi:hypothetical protein